MRNSLTQAIAKTSIALLLLGTAAAVGAQTNSTSSTNPSGAYTTTNTSTGSSTGTGSVTPGTPNTGAGGDMALNLSVLIASAIVAALGASVMVRRRLS